MNFSPANVAILRRSLGAPTRKRFREMWKSYSEAQQIQLYTALIGPVTTS
jgi:hypothetical protein